MEREHLLTGRALLYILYRMLGIIIDALLPVTLPIIRILAPEWETEHRLGRYQEVDRPAHAPLIWIHVASVGEVQAARALIAALSDKIPGCSFLLTVTTRQGREVAQTGIPGNVRCELAPLDTPSSVNRAIRAVRPDIYICLETELWPMMLTAINQAGIPMLLLNGRMSDRSLRRYQRIRGFITGVLNNFTAVAAITAQDSERYRRLGVDPDRIQVCGNIKYTLQTSETERVRKKYQQLLRSDGKVVFICGSTRSGEEELLLPVYKRLHRETSAGLLWIIAPRHLNRLAEIGSLLEKAGLTYDLLSRCMATGRKNDIVVVDSIGELAVLYAVGEYNFCGGSLVDKGGHNIMEPISCRKPVWFGPFMDDFQDAADLVLAAGAGFQVNNADELADSLVAQMWDNRLYQQTRQAAVRLASTQRDSALRQAEMIVQQITARKFVSRQNVAAPTLLNLPH